LGWNTAPIRKLSDSDLNCRIQKKAKALWEKKGCVQGKDLDIWLEAEKLVKKSYSIFDFPLCAKKNTARKSRP